MTTHLEEVVSNYEDKFSDLIGAYDNAHLTYESIRNFIINAHIKYLEGSKERLEKIKEDIEIKLSIAERKGYENLAHTLKVEKAMIDEEISHKQQELLQAKELLK